jgi:hypothetical protein
MNAQPRTEYAKPGDWEAQKPTIRRLYMDENAKLKDIVRIMADEHSFRATYGPDAPRRREARADA